MIKQAPIRPLLALGFGNLVALLVVGCHGASQSPVPADNRTHSATAPAGVFRDAAAAAGVDFKWGHGGRSPLNIIETLGHGCAFLDYDQDGLMDLLVVGNRRCGLFHNDGNGRFTDVSQRSGLNLEGELCGLAVGDYDNDGRPDLYITGYGKCALYHNTGQGRFEDVTSRSGLAARSPYDVVSAAAFVDLNGDGKLDLFAGRYIQFRPDTIRWCVYSGVKAGCGVKNYDPDLPHVYRNNGNGTFTDVTQAWGFGSAHGRCLGVAVAAAESGRGVQLYVANDELPADLMVPQGERYQNIGVTSGTAYNRDGLTQGGMGTDWGDFNNDGRPDLVVATFQSEPKSLYRNDGCGMFSEIGGLMGIAQDTTAYVAWTAKFLDYDNDGWMDLLFTNGHSQDNAHQVEAIRTYEQRMQLYHNDQGRLFRYVRSEAGSVFDKPIVGRGAAVGDYDNDGRPDVLVVNEEGPALLLHNEERSPHHRLAVLPHGVRCNRDGIGARIRVTVGDKTYVRDQSLSGGYLSSHDPRVHFGLGNAQGTARVEIDWPNGHVDRVQSVPIDQTVEITEGGQLKLSHK